MGINAYHCAIHYRKVIRFKMENNPKVQVTSSTLYYSVLQPSTSAINHPSQKRIHITCWDTWLPILNASKMMGKIKSPVRRTWRRQLRQDIKFVNAIESSAESLTEIYSDGMNVQSQNTIVSWLKTNCIWHVPIPNQQTNSWWFDVTIK